MATHDLEHVRLGWRREFDSAHRVEVGQNPSPKPSDEGHHVATDICGIFEQADILLLTKNGHAFMQIAVWQARLTKSNLKTGLV